MSQSVLVTGAAGLIGSQIAQLLIARGLEVVAFDRAVAPAKPRGTGRCVWIAGDVRDEALLHDAMVKHRVDRVIHAASILQSDCQKDPYLGIKVNVDGTLAVLEAARRAGAGHVVFTSTIAVYGGTMIEPMSETHPCAPKSIYGCAKLLCEQVGGQYAAQGHLQFTALRFGLVYGPGRVGSAGVASRFQDFVREAIDHRIIRLPRANPRKPFLFSSDAAMAAVEACVRAGQPAGGAFNISGEAHKMSEVGDTLRQMCPGAQIVYEDQVAQQGEVNGALDTRRAERELGFRPSVSMRRGLEQIKEFLAGAGGEEVEK